MMHVKHVYVTSLPSKKFIIWSPVVVIKTHRQKACGDGVVSGVHDKERIQMLKFLRNSTALSSLYGVDWNIGQVAW